jgi:hypothetical protein
MADCSMYFRMRAIQTMRWAAFLFLSRPEMEFMPLYPSRSHLSFSTSSML